MKTTVMFINQAEPLVGVRVRLAGDSNVHVTNNEGKIEIDMISGTHTFEIEVQGKWVHRTLSRKGDATLFIVDISKQREGGLSTMNTLQMDLANMVGDRYVFETVLGRGGMGVVVKAIDRLLNRPVAIKMLSDELQDNEEAQQIFLVEARNLATLSHPNLVAIHDILSIDGRVLMVFEYVLGENLEKMVEKRGVLPQMEALRLLIQLTRVVSYLHDHELIHRDLKPSNVIVQGDGTVKLVDFGLARSLNELYVRGTRVRGTPAYMAPEQVMGIGLTVGTDIYQLGISMYEILAAELPFPSGDMAYAHVHKEPPLLSEKRSDLDPDFVRLVDSCLKKQPKDRPATARELLEKLSVIYSRLSNGEDLMAGLNEPAALADARRTTNSAVAAVKPETHFEAIESGEIEIPLEKSSSNGPPPWAYGLGGLLVIVIVLVGFLMIRGEKSPDVSATAVAAPVEAKNPSVEVAAPEEPKIAEATSPPPAQEPVPAVAPDPSEGETPVEPEDQRPATAEAVGAQIKTPKTSVANPDTPGDGTLPKTNKTAGAKSWVTTGGQTAAQKPTLKPENTSTAQVPAQTPADEVPALLPAKKKTGSGLLDVDGPKKDTFLPVE